MLIALTRPIGIILGIGAECCRRCSYDAV